VARPQHIVVLGCGSVSQCTVPLLVSQGIVDPARLTIIDMVDNRDRVAGVLAAGVRYEIAQITPDNMGSVLGGHLSPGDMCIDLAWNIDTCAILQWCRDHGVRYLNTSVELWDPYSGSTDSNPLQRTLYVRHMDIRRMVASWPDNAGPTAVVEHGANPGLVSHFVRQALSELGAALLRDGLCGEPDGLEAALADEHYAEVARLAGVKVVHISERDTQISNQPKQVDEFVNTWSVEGFYEEGIAPAELGWGTHEKLLPPGAFVHADDGPCNQIALARPGASTWVRSWVPMGEITGMVIRHGEAFTMSDHLTVWDHSGARPKPLYRPTVHYAYCPASDAVSSMHELQMRQWQLQPTQRILGDEIVSGRDELGVLLMGHAYRSWWTGSLLDIHEARALAPGQNATTLQVAASILGAVTWMIEHDHAGVRVPDELPWREVLRVARPFLGPMWSGPSDWDPLSGRVELFAGFDGRVFDNEDPWQFTNFLV
jgi:homospermidine synthase